MVFAWDKDNGGLLAFPSVVEAAAHCKGVDVQDGYWLFFSDDGSPLEAWFDRPNLPESPEAVSYAYTLQRAMSGRWLQERLDQVASIKGCGLTNLAELTETLKINRGKRVMANARPASPPGSA